jgi:hypothetical protein
MHELNEEVYEGLHEIQDGFKESEDDGEKVHKEIHSTSVHEAAHGIRSVRSFVSRFGV